MSKKRTLIKVNFQYKPEGHSRPLDYIQEEPLRYEIPYGGPISTIPIPSVGDTVWVSLKEEGGQEAYKVLTRHFDYTYHEQVGLEISVNIVVTDVSDDEMAARLKA